VSTRKSNVRPEKEDMATKNFLTSKTVWGIITIVVSQFVPGAVDITTMPSDALGWAKVAISLAGALLALYGRWKATTPLTAGPSQLPISVTNASKKE
jgi:hypothetical protein